MFVCKRAVVRVASASQPASQPTSQPAGVCNLVQRPAVPRRSWATPSVSKELI